MSPIFGLAQPRSIEAEKTIQAAIAAFSDQQPERDSLAIKSIDDALHRYLAQDDDFWPRWNFFASSILKNDKKITKGRA
jgi:hypothetical protein